MIEAAKAIIKLLNRRGFQAYFIGGKARTELHNLFHYNDKVPINNINIITTATKNDILKIFPMAKDDKLNSMRVVFANINFLISFFTDDVNVQSLLIPIKSFTSNLINAGKLDEERNNRDFTINAIVQDKRYNYIDFTYEYYRKNISAINDIKYKIIRCIEDPLKNFTKDPIRILRMIRLQSQLGYTIDKRTFNAAKVNLSLLSNVSLDEIKTEFNKIITGKFISMAFQTMFDLELFDLTINNQKFMPSFKNIDLLTIKQLERFNKKITYIDDINKKYKIVDLIEAYTILLSPSLHQQQKPVLDESLNLCLDKNEIDTVKWLLSHLNIFVRNDLQQYFFEIKNDDFIKNDRLTLLKLIRHIVNIASVLVNKDTGKFIYDIFCSKPLFAEQLRVTKNDLLQLIGVNNEQYVDDIYEAILKRLLYVKKWPYEYKDYMEIVKQGINDILPNLEIEIKDWAGKIDDYGNYMPHHKAVQYYRVPLDVNKLEDLNISSFEALEKILAQKNK